MLKQQNSERKLVELCKQQVAHYISSVLLLFYTLYKTISITNVMQ
jgi:hypothetical protein